ncbi:uncharacterized protein [Oryza sativa Japonica Group]|jgi:hypothetical protein|uniref:Os06g0111700 protein n=2 Tax=Oryza sativa subsp. japonica TaxID=39947 RepID=A0A5S6R6H2_ORYSJ|nr:uncharacterized protein LOC4339894 [Oryza sativa Japonica Group]EAZ35580.1 hypothetical protein OsJ_19866 [Oryza sativa Japonica Group]KAF2924820.1 hypothetical protein DAI22_06g006800 [Oryza sativa Japonica Group]BAD67776.1 DnaJ protein-like [Oryza sativa Japonica Group]BAF18502.2 Os06g0111700 [Oryza sativa Japonica Group]BAS95796.1 Os06g0111700 [Oryza sativa Japonica Group]|eukprot:NP_001056588.2 Os06g0111700 [Oryza sativa Japonica Group]
MPGGPSRAADADDDDDDELSRLLSLAEADLEAGRLRAAHKHARRAARLDPDSTRASLLLTAVSVLAADDSSHRATLLLPDSPHSQASPLSPSALRRHYKSLSESLRSAPPSSSPAVSSAVKEALRRAADAYAALANQAAAPVPPTFWTACAGCRLLHEFDRKYVGFRLMCPSCRRTFLASEVPPPPEAEAEAEPDPLPPAKKKPKTQKREMTLAEMQLQLSKKRATNNSSRLDEDDDDDNDDDDDDDEGEEQQQNNDSEMMDVEDSDFYNFDADRCEKCFKRGQVWALYGDDDGMPRHYALVEMITPGGRFRAQIRWLDLQPDGGEGTPCGEFKVGRTVTVHSVNIFSHQVAYERVAREVYRIYPKKGSVWALHGGKDADSGRPKYEFVVFLSGYSDLYGASFGYLEKVEGFRSIFTRQDVGRDAVQTLHKGDMGKLSHQIPARRAPKGEGSTLPPTDCWELDPASLPSELLHDNQQK